MISFVKINCQNLIQNPSFENYSECPEGIGQGATTYITYADGWDYLMKTPDYFHICATNGASVPNNFFGEQEPATGNGYAGFITYLGLFQDLREGITTELLSPLNMGETYYCSFKISLAENAGLACNNIGMFFSMEFNQIPQSQNEFDLGNFSQVFESEIISNTEEWVSISGSFVADSSYNYVSILNNFNDSITETMEMPFGINTIENTSYYYVDDICVSSNPIDCQITTAIKEIENELAMKVYPTVTNSKININFFKEYNKLDVDIYDIRG